MSGATATTLQLVTDPPSPAQLAAWNRLWRLLLAENSPPCPEGKPESSNATQGDGPEVASGS